MRPRIEDDRVRIDGATTAGVVLGLLVGSLVCVALAPTLMPDSYSIVEHSISESAAQGVEGAWLARTGFLLLGFAVLVLASVGGTRWGVAGRLVHRAYGVAMIAVAAFAHMPWENVPSDAFEDTLHSVAASTVGAAFTIGVLIVATRRSRTWMRVFDALAVAAALGFSMAMFNVEGIAGVVQRTMFVVGYLWYGAEAIRSAGPFSRSHPQAPVPRTVS